MMSLNHPVSRAILALGFAMALAFVPGCFPGLPSLDKPSALNRIGVATGEGFMTRTEFLTDETPGPITQVIQGEFDRSGARLIGIAGESGVIFVDAGGSVKRKVTWNTNFGSRTNIVDINGDHVPEFMDRGSWGDTSHLMDKDGKVLWTAQAGAATDDMAMGDVNGDGKPEFAVGYNGSSYIRLLDVSGKEIWSIPSGNVWHVEMIDTNGDGKDEIIHSAEGLTVLDGQGAVITQTPMFMQRVYMSHFDVVNWPDAAGKVCVVQCGEGAIWLLNLDGSVEKKLDAPASVVLGDTYAALVCLNTGQADYLAVLVNHDIWNVAVLYVYDNTGKLVYDEVLPWSAPALAAVKLGSDDTETLMVGSGTTVWKYEVKQR